MRLLVKNQKENKPKEWVMPDKEEAKLPFVMKKYKIELKQYYFKKERNTRSTKQISQGTMHPEYEEQSGEPKG
jgi:hypothetical protein